MILPGKALARSARLLALAAFVPWLAQAAPAQDRDEQFAGVPLPGSKGISLTVGEIAERQRLADLKPHAPRPMKPEHEIEREIRSVPLSYLKPRLRPLPKRFPSSIPNW